MKFTLARIAMGALAAVPLAGLFPLLANADTVTANFESPTYSLGTINDQDGWSALGSAGSGCATYDEGVSTSNSTPGFGSQSFRISDAVTSGCFGDQAFSKSLTNAAGEATASTSTFSAGTIQPHFEAQFDIAPVAPGSTDVMSVSPDRGDGARMSYLRFEDDADGVEVYFDDVTDPTHATNADTFNETKVATLSTTTPHTIKLTMDFVSGPDNDVVNVYIDGTLVHTGTSWEDYYLYDTESNPGLADEQSRIVRNLEFRESSLTAHPANVGKGYLIDNLSLESGPTPTPPPSTVKVTIDKFIDGSMATATSANSDSFPMTASWSATNIGTGTGSYALGPTGANSTNAYEAITSDMTSGANYSTSEVPDGVIVGSDCSTGAAYALAGYKTGTSLEAAEDATFSTTAPSFTNLTSDEYVIVLNTTCPPQATLKVHILKYLDGAEATATSAGNYQFPMVSTWQTANLNGGATTSGAYALGDNYGGTTELYGADTAAMSSPASYTTSETTSGASNVVSDPSLCAPGKYVLNGYRVSATSFADAATQPLSAIAPAFFGLTADEYVIVDNSSCPKTGSLTIEKDTIGGNATFSFVGGAGIGTFTLTTIGNKNGGTASQTFSNLTPGTYHVTETSKSGWTQTDSECSTVTVTAGENAVCIITNTNNKLLGEIRGTKYEDEDGDGKLHDGDHHRLAGWTIYLDTNNNGKLDSGEPSDVTDSHGNYDFIGLTAGTYHVREVGQTGWTQTLPGGNGSYTVNLSAGQVAKNKNFGNFKYGTISGMKFNDANGDHRKDNGEKGLAGWTIVLHGPNHTTQSTVTDANGNYSFTGLSAGLYTLTEVQKSGWEQTLHPGSVWISSGDNEKNRNFGNKAITKPDHHNYNNYTD